MKTDKMYYPPMDPVYSQLSQNKTIFFEEFELGKPDMEDVRAKNNTTFKLFISGKKVFEGFLDCKYHEHFPPNTRLPIEELMLKANFGISPKNTAILYSLKSFMKEDKNSRQLFLSIRNGVINDKVWKLIGENNVYPDKMTPEQLGDVIDGPHQAMMDQFVFKQKCEKVFLNSQVFFERKWEEMEAEQEGFYFEGGHPKMVLCQMVSEGLGLMYSLDIIRKFNIEILLGSALSHRLYTIFQLRPDYTIFDILFYHENTDSEEASKIIARNHHELEEFIVETMERFIFLKNSFYQEVTFKREISNRYYLGNDFLCLQDNKKEGVDVLIEILDNGIAFPLDLMPGIVSELSEIIGQDSIYDGWCVGEDEISLYWSIGPDSYVKAHEGLKAWLIEKDLGDIGTVSSPSPPLA